MGHIYQEAQNLLGVGSGSPKAQIGGIAGIQQDFARQVLAGQIPPGFRTGIENQFNVAQNQAMDLLPRGGQLNSALMNLNTQRAQSIGTLPAQLLPLAFGGLGQAEQAYGGLQASNNQKKAGTGQALGKMAAAKMLGPAVAAG